MPTTVNAKNVLKLRDFLLDSDYKFDMGTCVVKDGAAGCIGGFASVLWPEISKPYGETYTTWDRELLQEKLRITKDTEFELCFMPVQTHEISREDAIETLTKLAETGEVDWSHVS